jgi:hypothetical protein
MKKIIIIILFSLNFLTSAQVLKTKSLQFEGVTTSQQNLLNGSIDDYFLVFNNINERFEFFNGSVWSALNSSGANNTLTESEILQMGFIKTDTNTQLSNSEVLAITDPKYLLNTTDIFNGDLTITNDLVVNGLTTYNFGTIINTNTSGLNGLSVTKSSDDSAAALKVQHNTSSISRSIADFRNGNFSAFEIFGDLSSQFGGNVTAPYFIGNGSLLTNISFNDLEDKPTFTDTNTQLTESEITNLGFIKGGDFLYTTPLASQNINSDLVFDENTLSNIGDVQTQQMKFYSGGNNNEDWYLTRTGTDFQFYYSTLAPSLYGYQLNSTGTPSENRDLIPKEYLDERLEDNSSFQTYNGSGISVFSITKENLYLTSASNNVTFTVDEIIASKVQVFGTAGNSITHDETSNVEILGSTTIGSKGYLWLIRISDTPVNGLIQYQCFN